jgi:hypothetical protein
MLSLAFWRSSNIFFFRSSNSFFRASLSANFFCLFSSINSALVFVSPSGFASGAFDV